MSRAYYAHSEECRGNEVRIPALLLLASCTAPGPSERQVDIVITNTTERLIEVSARRGWVFREFVGNEIRLRVSEGLKRPE
jgi:hypothetical protein